ncbi:hypothetical protein HDU98_002338, partial [Podochytrium sp. JEL0797]
MNPFLNPPSPPHASQTSHGSPSHSPGNPFAPRATSPSNPFLSANTTTTPAPSTAPSPLPSPFLAHQTFNLTEFDPLAQPTNPPARPLPTPPSTNQSNQATNPSPPITTPAHLPSEFPPPPAYADDDERLAIEIALHGPDVGVSVDQAQIEADEALARSLAEVENGVASLGAGSLGVVAAPDIRNDVPVSDESLSDEALARALQEEEDAVARSETARHENSFAYHPTDAMHASAYPQQQQQNLMYASAMPQQRQQYPGYTSAMPQQQYPGYTSAMPQLPPRDTTAFYTPAPMYGTNAIGLPFHQYGFPEESVHRNRFLSGEPFRDLDVCLWDRNCFTVMEGSTQMYYVNLLGNDSMMRRWVLKRNDSNGDHIMTISEARGKSFMLFDPKLVKSVTCTRPQTGLQQQIQFSTITNSEKLEWRDGELRVVHDVGLFSRRKAPTVGAGEDPDLFAYLVRCEIEGAMTRWRIRVGGRGMGKAEIAVASFVGMQMLDRG